MTNATVTCMYPFRFFDYTITESINLLMYCRYDDWRDPAEVALAYGRGMFCIVPLGKALFTTVSESVNLVASETIKILEQPDQLSSQSLQKVNNLSNQLHQVMFSVKNMQSNALKFNKISYQRP
ncbi:hypothetical protein R6Q57_000775 [Mikania cordata]